MANGYYSSCWLIAGLGVICMIINDTQALEIRESLHTIAIMCYWCVSVLHCLYIQSVSQQQLGS